jgi:hypothetical protein
VDYLTTHRLQWGKPDTLSLLPSVLDVSAALPPPAAPGAPPPAYFTADTPAELISIIQNDWPYSGAPRLSAHACRSRAAVPSEVEHTLVWTKLPIMHPALIHPSVAARIAQDGLCGFTGARTPPPPPDALPACLPALAEWGVTLDALVRSAPPSAADAAHVAAAGAEVHEFVRRRWPEREWETAWFVNPLVSMRRVCVCARGS